MEEEGKVIRSGALNITVREGRVVALAQLLLLALSPTLSHAAPRDSALRISPSLSAIAR